MLVFATGDPIIKLGEDSDAISAPPFVPKILGEKGLVQEYNPHQLLTCHVEDKCLNKT